MKQLGKVKIIAVVAVLAVIAVILWLMLRQKPEEGPVIHRNTQILTESFPTTVYIYGDQMALPYGVEATYINGLTENLLDSVDSENEYLMIVVNDVLGNAHLTSDDFELIEQMTKRSNIFFAYLGEYNLREFQARKIDSATSDIKSNDNLSFAFLGDSEPTLWVNGMCGDYTKDDYAEVDHALNDSRIFAGLQSTMICLLEIQQPEAEGGFR